MHSGRLGQICAHLLNDVNPESNQICQIKERVYRQKDLLNAPLLTYILMSLLNLDFSGINC